MESKRELKILIAIGLIFGIAFFLPVEEIKSALNIGNSPIETALYATFDLARWYAREHVILCLLPAFFIAGVISVFVSQGSVLRYFGANAKKWLAYTVASVSGTILAVCSCTILPLFSSIHKRGAGLGPAVAFLYSGPAINILAIILSAQILGVELGIARVIGAVLFSIILGLIMSFIYRKEEREKKESQMNIVLPPEKRPVSQTAFHFFTLVLILVFANWGSPSENDRSSVWYYIWSYKWYITGFLTLFLGYSLIKILKLKWQWVLLAGIVTVLSSILSTIYISNAKLSPLVPMLVGVAGLSIITVLDRQESDNKEWAFSTWDFAKQILPLLAIGVLIAGFLLGSTHDGITIAGIIPNKWVEWLVGGNSIYANLFSSIVGAFMYFATLTEVPIVQGLVASGMGKGPALALLLAGPSLSLPNMLVIRGVIGNQKTIVYVVLVIILSTIAGLIYGNL